MYQNKETYNIKTKIVAKNLMWEAHAYNLSTQKDEAGRVPTQG